jgi:signal transduction histidine kinase
MSSPPDDNRLRHQLKGLTAAWDERELCSEELVRAVVAAEAVLAAEEDGGPGRTQLEAWVALGRAYAGLLTAAYAEAESRAAAAAAGFASGGDVWARAWALVMRGTALYFQTRYVEGVAPAEEALGVFEQLGDLRGQAGALTVTANIARVSGDPVRGLGHAKRALEAAVACQHAPTEATCLNNLGTIAHSLGDFAQSVTYFEHALNRARAIGHHRIERVALNNIGASCEAAGDMEAALAWHQESLRLKEGGGDRRSLALSLNNLGIALKKLDRDDEALAKQERSLALFEEVGDRWGQAYCHQEFGDLARRRGDRPAARRHYERALELRREVGERLLVGEAVNTLADFLLEHGEGAADLARARELAHASLDIARETGALLVELYAHRLLHRVAKVTGDLARALEHCELALKLDRRVFSQESEKKLKNLRVLHEVEVAQRDLQAERERSRDLQAALDQAEAHRQRAVAADQYKGEVVRIVAHDLRNPVAAMRSLGELLADRHAGDPESREFCELIMSAADSVLNMVSNVLDSSILEEGGMVLQKAPVAVAALLQQVVQDHQPSARAKQQRVTLEVPADLTCVADTSRLTTIVANLLSNALKYSPAGAGVFVRGESRARAEGGAETVISVRDEGPGVSQTDLARMFGRFTRLTARPTGNEASTGLGLYLVRQLTQMHDGRVWAESPGPGRGATFYVALPVA